MDNSLKDLTLNSQDLKKFITECKKKVSSEYFNSKSIKEFLAVDFGNKELSTMIQIPKRKRTDSNPLKTLADTVREDVENDRKKLQSVIDRNKNRVFHEEKQRTTKVLCYLIVCFLTLFYKIINFKMSDCSREEGSEYLLLAGNFLLGIFGCFFSVCIPINLFKNFPTFKPFHPKTLRKLTWIASVLIMVDIVASGICIIFIFEYSCEYVEKIGRRPQYFFYKNYMTLLTNSDTVPIVKKVFNWKIGSFIGTLIVIVFACGFLFCIANSHSNDISPKKNSKKLKKGV